MKPKLSPEAAREVLQMMRECAAGRDFLGTFGRTYLVRSAWSRLIGRLSHFADIPDAETDDLLPNAIEQAAKEADERRALEAASTTERGALDHERDQRKASER